jgi:hypothetical protein
MTDQGFSIEKIRGAPGETRTPDPLVRSQMLYPAELRARGIHYNLVAGSVERAGASRAVALHPTGCIVETNSGISILISVPSPGRLSICKRKSAPYSTRKRSRTLLNPIPST